MRKFRSMKSLGRHQSENSTSSDTMAVPQLKADHHGMGVVVAGQATAWSRSFRIGGSLTPKPVSIEVDEVDDLLDDVGDDLLNPAVDQDAWNSNWYRERASNEAAMMVLKDKPEGTFVVRDSSAQPGSFALSYRHKGETHHTLIHGTPQGLKLANSDLLFVCLSDFVQHFSMQWTPSSNELPCALNPNSLKLRDCSGGNVQAWSLEHVVSWLQELGVDAATQLAFKNFAVDGQRLVELSDEELEKELGVTSTEDRNAIFEGLKQVIAQGPMIAKVEDGSLTVVASKVAPKRKMPPPPGTAPAKPMLKKPEDSAAGAADPSTVDAPPEITTAKTEVVPLPVDTATPVPPTHSYNSIMKGTRMKPLNRRVTFDEEALLASKHMLAVLRGIHGRVDWIACEAGYYLGQVPKDQAVEKLRGAQRGTFVIYDSLACKETLFVTYVGPESMVHSQIKNTNNGLFLKGSKIFFATLHELVVYFSSPNPEMPSIFHLPNEQGEELETVAAINSTETPAAQAPLGALWYKATISRLEAMQLVEFEPSGSFVVRDGDVEGYIITYVHNGRIRHLQVIQGETSCMLAGSELEFPSMHALVDHYTKDASSGDMDCVLRVPKGTAPAMKPAMTHPAGPEKEEISWDKSVTRPNDDEDTKVAYLPSNPVYTQARMPGKGGSSSTAGGPGKQPWLQLAVPKRQALQSISAKADGAFVIRASESRSGSYVLSYKFGGQIYHEIIVEAPGDVPLVFLERVRSQQFPSMQALVQYYEQPRPELPVPLCAEPTYAEPTMMGEEADLGRQKMPMRSNSKAQLCKQQSRQSLGTSTLKRGVSSLSTHGAPGTLSRGASQVDIAKPSLNRPTMVATLGTPVHIRDNINDAVGNLMSTRIDERAKTATWFCLGLSKETAIGRLPANQEGAFVIRDNPDSFATLSMVVKSKIFNAHIVESPQGLHLKKSQAYQQNLSALVAYYKIPTQKDLPRCLVNY